MSNDKLTFDQIRKKISKNVKCFQWTRGRQIGEYLIMPIIRTKKLPFDQQKMKIMMYLKYLLLKMMKVKAMTYMANNQWSYNHMESECEYDD